MTGRFERNKKGMETLMRILISSLLVALVSLAGAALTPSSAASPGAVSQDQDIALAAPAVEKATYGWRRRHYGYGYDDGYGYGYRYRDYPRYYGYNYYPRYYGYYHRPRYYGWRNRGWRRNHW